MPRSASRNISFCRNGKTVCPAIEPFIILRSFWLKGKVIACLIGLQKEELIFSIRDLTKFGKKEVLFCFLRWKQWWHTWLSADCDHFLRICRKSGFNLEWPAWFLYQNQCRKSCWVKLASAITNTPRSPTDFLLHRINLYCPALPVLNFRRISLCRHIN